MATWDERVDVVVVGSGAAGLSAAIEAGHAGASVVVLEKMRGMGGNTRISDGSLAAPGNHLQKAVGIEDSPDLFYDDMLRAGLGLNHPHLVRTVAERAAEAVSWTIDVLGVEYLDRLDRFGGHSVARALTTVNHVGADITRAQRAELKRMGVEIRTGCLMTSLRRDVGGAVDGVEIREGYQFGEPDSGSVRHIRAGGGVVLATGGFGNDVGFRALQNPVLGASVASTNHRGATAEGLVAAMSIGAVPVHLSFIQTGPWGCPDETGYGHGARFASYSLYPTGILVDPATGSRIVSEWADRKRRTDAIFKTGHICVGIVDAKGAEKDPGSLERSLRRGKIKAFDNLTDLAAAYGMPPGRLETTVASYNDRVLAREPDELGKPLDRGDALPLEAPPYYGLRIWPKVHYTVGGVGIDSYARVLDLRGRPIPGLFAAGEVCGGVHGASRLGSCALTDCVVFGRIAGQQAAAAVRS
ncbi:MAG: flavocytochrome c [Anaerolineae bacterium]|jgi:flavocytochrome c